jgi:hypothetical protein
MSIGLASGSLMHTSAQANDKSLSQSKPVPGQGGVTPSQPVYREPDPINFDDMTGWQSMFDGRTLNGWSGDPNIWKVVDGAIVGKRPPAPEAGPAFRGTYLVWQGGEPADFELRLEIKLEGSGADSGINYRAFVAPMRTQSGMPQPSPDEAKWNLGGYQFDFHATNLRTNGQVAKAAGIGSIAYRGQVVRTATGENARLISSVGDDEALGSFFKSNDWNQVDLIARGDTLIQIINGHVMAILIDDDPAKSWPKGLIGLQYAGSPSKISFRKIRIRTLP